MQFSSHNSHSVISDLFRPSSSWIAELAPRFASLRVVQATLPIFAGTQLIDRHGRVHDSLRISVTDRCNIRCFYCMPDVPDCHQPRTDILTFDEIERVVRRAAAAGVRKLRFTGGEPLRS